MTSRSLKTLKIILLSTPLLYVYALILGVLAGYDAITGLQSLGTFMAQVFIRLFKCISLPVIALSIIVTLINYQSDMGMKQIWQRTMRYTLTTTLIAACVACFLYLLVHPDLVQSVPIHHDLGLGQGGGYLKHLVGLFPESFLAPFLDQQIMAALFVSLLVGFAIRKIPDEKARDTISFFFRGLHSLLMVITGWIVKIIPLGLFGFITTTVIQLRSGTAIKGIGEYLLIVVLANIIQGFVILPLWLKMQGVKPYQAMKAMLPALFVAFFSKSSVGTLPITMNTIEKNMGVKSGISRFVLPLCTSINMNGCAAFIFTTVIYVMQNNGIPINLGTMFLWVFIASIAAIGNAGVPMGCYFLSISLLSGMNVPIALMGIILPFYSLIDMLETALNVWSDICVTKVVDVKDNQKAQDLVQYPQTYSKEY